MTDTLELLVKQGTDTRTIQRALVKLGYRLDVDNIRGRKTIAAIVDFKVKHGLSSTPTVGPKTMLEMNTALGALGHMDRILDTETPPWTEELLRRLGLQEERDKVTLRAFLASDGATIGDPTKFPWCGDAVETPIAITLPEEPLPANPYYALNWQKFGVPTSIAAFGAIVTFERRDKHGKLIGGHVGFIVGHDELYWHVLGGNQSDKITISKIAKSRQEGSLRWPSTYTLPTRAMEYSTLQATITTNEA